MKDPTALEILNLISATTDGDEELVARLLTEQPAIIDRTSERGLTPLHYAALHGQTGVGKILIEAGANVDARTTDAHSMTPLMLARFLGHHKVAGALSAASRRTGGGCGASQAVTLHIYDVLKHTRLINGVCRAIGTGAFHAAVEVFGCEYSFGFTPRGSGLFGCAPGGCEAHAYRESVPMGSTQMTEEEVGVMLEQVSEEWPGNTYDLLRRNCCHFSEAFCLRLGVGEIPGWVKNLAGTGAALDAGVRGFASAAQMTAIIAAAKAAALADSAPPAAMQTVELVKETANMSVDYNAKKIAEFDEMLGVTRTASMSMDYNSRKLSEIGSKLEVRRTAGMSMEYNTRKLKELDQRLELSRTVSMSAEWNVRKIVEWDKKLGVSETAAMSMDYNARLVKEVVSKGKASRGSTDAKYKFGDFTRGLISKFL